MRVDDPIQGVSVRNTKRHIRQKWLKSAVGDNGPQLPEYLFPITRKDLEDHVHPRSKRTPKCPCGFPAKPCPIDTETGFRNYCYKREDSDG